jgi:hypothetical protein
MPATIDNVKLPMLTDKRKPPFPLVLLKVPLINLGACATWMYQQNRQA